MNKKTVLILGGYGSTGLPLASLLLAETDVLLVLAGRSGEKAKEAAASLNGLFEGERVAGIHADASNSLSLRQAFEGVDIVVVASSTARYASTVARAAIRGGLDYLDIQVSSAKLAALRTLEEEINRAGRCFITEAGLHTGLTATLVRAVAPRFDRLERANVGTIMKLDWASLTFTRSTMNEFVEGFLEFEPLVFCDGSWRLSERSGRADAKTMEFGAPLGRQYCVPMFLEELRALPELYPTLQETGFFMGGFNWFVDWIVMPMMMGALYLAPSRGIRPMARLLEWGLKTFSKPPFRTLLKVEARGEKDDQRKAVDILLGHDDGYKFTAIAVAACLLQHFDGSIARPGLLLMGHVVEPGRLLLDMERMGVEVQTTVNQGEEL